MIVVLIAKKRKTNVFLLVNDTVLSDIFGYVFTI